MLLSASFFKNFSLDEIFWINSDISEKTPLTYLRYPFFLTWYPEKVRKVINQRTFIWMSILVCNSLWMTIIAFVLLTPLSNHHQSSFQSTTSQCIYKYFPFLRLIQNTYSCACASALNTIIVIFSSLVLLLKLWLTGFD